MATSAPERFVLGIDYGTLSARAVLVRIADGAEVAVASHAYEHGVLDERLPEGGPQLGADVALQDPRDWTRALRRVVPDVLEDARERDGVDPSQVVGVGVDFTSCTVLPTTADGTPLCRLPRFADRPQAWPKLWKHHAAQPQADRINALAEERGEGWLARYGGKISSEWFFPKALEILDADPEVYRAADRLIEAGDWLVWRLCGQEVRSASQAGYKATYQDGSFPERDFLAALDPDFADVVAEKMDAPVAPLGTAAGPLSDEAAGWTGLAPGIPVAVANIDAHVAFPATGRARPGTMVVIMGTSTCHITLSRERQLVEGISGVVDGGVIPGLFGYEAGQAAVGDAFGWFADGIAGSPDDADAHERLTRLAADQAPGEHGLVALDWLNGNRSVLVDAELSGLVVGMTLATRPEDIYRALLEATAFGTRMIVEAFADGGVAVDELVATGGLPGRNPLLMQIYADVLQRPIAVAGTDQGPARGAAIYAAVAAGCYPDLERAAAAMGAEDRRVYRPDPDAGRTYDALYTEYRRLHDHFGRASADAPGGVMKRLRALRDGARRIDAPPYSTEEALSSRDSSRDSSRGPATSPDVGHLNDAD